MNATDIINQITEAAPLVATARGELDAAIDAERTAEAEVLARAIELARPALRALVSRIVRESYETAGRNGCNPVSRTEYHDERGLVLVDGYETCKDASGNRGSISGCRLYLLSDGTLAEATREGSFSHWQGEADSWTSTLAPKTVRDAMNEYALDDCLTALRDALVKQRDGKANDRAKAARERAAQLEALVTLAK